MTGIEMMLKAFGFKPEELMGHANDLKMLVGQFKEGMDNLNVKADLQLAALLRIESKVTGAVQLPDGELIGLQGDALEKKMAEIDERNKTPLSPEAKYHWLKELN